MPTVSVNLTGTFVAEGTEILSIGSHDRKELQLSIDQNALDTFSQRTGQPVRVRLAGSRPFASILSRLSPRASVVPPHTAFCAPRGGPLAVRVSAQATDDDGLEFLAPRFTGFVTLTAENSARFHAGQLAVVSLYARNESIGEHVYYAAARWVRQRLQRVRR